MSSRAIAAGAMVLLCASHARAEDAPAFESVVTGSRTESRLADAPIATEVITRTDIERLGARDAAEVLAGQPGVQIDRSFNGASVSLQGLDPQYVLILIDGQRMIGRIEGAIDLTRLPVDDIERIEIVRGPSSALWGADALGGVINIITRRSRKKWEADGRVSYGSLNAADVALGAGLKRERGTLRLTGGYHRRDPFDLNPDNAATSGNGFDEFDIAARGEVRAKRLKLRAGGDYFQRKMNGIDEAGGGAIFDRINLTQTASVQVTPEINFSFPGKLRLTGYYTWFRDQFRQDQRGSDALDVYQDTREQLGRLEVQYDHVLPRGHFLSVGLEGQIEHLQSERLDGGSSLRGRGAAYIQDQWSLQGRGIKAALVPAVRVDADSQFGWAVSPKLAVRVDPHPKIVLRASYGRGFRPPSFKELLLRFANVTANYVVEGNPNLGPETSDGINVGGELKAVPGLWFSINYFWNKLHNLIQPDVIDGGVAGAPMRFQYVNIASAWTTGIESAVRIGPFQGVSLDLGATLTLSEDEALHRPLPGRAVLRGNFLLSIVPPRWGLEVTLRGTIYGPRPIYIEDDTRYTVPYLLLDARIGQTIKKHVTLFVSAQNLVGAGDAEFTLLPPRQFFGGVIGRY
jgi:outer membrane receptor for ferrienterochelin and colicins